MNSIDPKPNNSKFNDEQWQAIHEYGSNILVAASAGSGKTTVLIERILTHLRKKRANINELLVVTFTEAAAKEMKERLESQLKKEYNTITTFEEQQFLIDQINLLPQAHIQTLHSFCLHVIQNYFYLIDFNPSVELMTSEVEKELLYEEAWSLVCKVIEKQESHLISVDEYEELLHLFSGHRSDQGLFQLILKLYLFAVSLPEPKLWLTSINKNQSHFDDFQMSKLFLDSIQREFRQTFQTASTIYNKLFNETSNLAAINIERYLPIIEEEFKMIESITNKIESDTFTELISLTNSLTFKNWPKPPKPKENPDLERLKELSGHRKDAKEMINKLKETYCQFSWETLSEIEAQISLQLETLANLTLEFYQSVNTIKTNKNVIDYNDLEHLTLKILRQKDANTNHFEPTPAALYYQGHFKEVLVDEYQDINEIQAEILAWLSHEHFESLPGNLFMVGDVKQSIYGFRNAEPSLFLDKYVKYQDQGEGKLIILDQNYRSRDEVLQFTNYLFERIMDPEFGEMAYGLDESLKTGNKAFLPGSPHPDFNIHFLLHESKTHEEGEIVDKKESQGENVFQFDTHLEAQTYLVAQKIRELVKNQSQIYDKETGKLRPIEYRDIVILSSTRKPFLQVQQTFDFFKIPLLAQKVENYFQRQEVQLMLALMKIIDNPYQDLPLVAILRSYFVGLNDDQLSIIRIHHQDKSYFEALMASINDFEAGKLNTIDMNFYQQLKNFINKLTFWRDFSLNHTIVELIWQIYHDSLFIEFVSGLSNPDQRLANLHGFYEEAQRFEQSNFKGLYGFVSYIEELLKYDKDLSEPQVLNPKQNFVRIMTVHASKGLEFPVVFLINIEKRFNIMDANSERVINLRDEGSSIDFYDYHHFIKYPSIVRKAMKLVKENQLKAEEMRKLYVALTRCEQRLYLVGSVATKEKWLANREKINDSITENQLIAPTYYRQKAQSWLEWFNIALAIPQQGQRNSHAEFKDDQIIFEFVNSESLLANQNRPNDQMLEFQNEESKTNFDGADNIPKIKKLEDFWHIQYPYLLATKTSSYQSVSELKRLFEEPTIPKSDHYSDHRKLAFPREFTNLNIQPIQAIRYTEDTFLMPKFLAPENKYTAADIGTFTHQYLQHLNYELFKHHPEEAYDELIVQENQRLLQEAFLNEKQINAIHLEKIIRYLRSDIGQFLINNASEITRETPFSLLIPAEKLFENQVKNIQVQELRDNDLVVHGVIDAFIATDSSVYLIDFKTDRQRFLPAMSKSQQVEEIIEKYRFQMNLYALALSNQFPHKKVNVYLYLLDFDAEIYMNEYLNLL